MSGMSQQGLLIRISFLKGEIANLETSKHDVEDARNLMMIDEQIRFKSERIDENQQWLRILDKDPGFGKLVNVGGRYEPKMPTFGTKEEVEYALENPDTIREEYAETDEQTYMATRSEVQRHYTEQALKRMDGDGAYAEQEKCGQSNEES